MDSKALLGSLLVSSIHRFRIIAILLSFEILLLMPLVEKIFRLSFPSTTKDAPAVTTPPTGDYLYKNNLTLSGTSYSSPVSVSAANMSSRWNGTINFGIWPGDIHIREVEDLFYKYGSIVDIDLKIPPRPPYAFVKFVNFTEIMKRDSPQSATETAFALAALMEIPLLL